MRKISSSNAQGLASTARALAKLGRDDATLFAALSQAALLQISSLHAQEPASALARLGKFDAKLLDVTTICFNVRVDYWRENFQGSRRGSGCYERR